MLLVLSLVLALVPHGAAAQSADRHASGNLPSRGVLVVGKSLAGVSLGASQETVKARWGSRYDKCAVSECRDPTWMYFYPRGERVGAAVRFRNNKAIAIFTLGATFGWKSVEGVKIADPASKVYEFYGNPRSTKCIGFEALSVTQNGVVTSFYLTSGVVYSYALTMPGATVCQ